MYRSYSYPFNYKNFRAALILSLLFSALLFVASFSIGKDKFFLLLNMDLGTVADYFFRFYTFSGDGLLWVPVFFYFLFYKRKIIFMPLLCFIFTTLFTQLPKNLIVDEFRPTKAISGVVIHTVKNVDLHVADSFPSGHTATAFTFYLLFCLVTEKKWWLWTGLLYALLEGYSRIYLAEHFPFDVAGGMVAAILSVTLSLLLQKLILQRGSNLDNLRSHK